ncbi:hypothetical protein HQ666_01060 [Enterococcus faecium]|nr:hypothetical protein [Enterococcus faecium]
MLIEGKTQLWFKFDPSNRFIKDFYKVWDSEVFFLAIEDSLLINLYYSNKNYFKIPAAKTRMNLDAYFLFDVVTNVPDVRAKHKRFDYVKYTFVDPEKYKD